MIAIRSCKMLLLAAMAFFFTLVAFNNLTDFDSNHQFVRHVLMMDSTLPGNHGMWRSIQAPLDTSCLLFLHHRVGKSSTQFLAGGEASSSSVLSRGPQADFHRAKQVGAVALTSGMLQWFIAFLCVGAEWFLMWQSKLWNGQDAAFRMFAIEGLGLVILLLPD